MAAKQLELDGLDAFGLHDEIMGARLLLNEQQLDFCERILDGEKQGAAYMSAGYTYSTEGTANSGASRLIKTVKISRYIRLCREQMRRAAGISREHLVEAQYQFMRQLRIDDPDKASKVGAELAKLLNFYPDPKAQKIEIESKNDSSLDLTGSIPPEVFELMDLINQDPEVIAQELAKAAGGDSGSDG